MIKQAHPTLSDKDSTAPFESIGAVIPVAGNSSRMGCFKPLLPFGNSTVIETTVSHALAYADTAVAVLGNRGYELRDLLSKRFDNRIRFAYNRDYASTDMLASVKLGLRELPDCRAFFLLPGDMPAIALEVFAVLTEAFRDSDEILIPVVDGRRGHPPLISSLLIPEILAYEGGGGLQAVFRKHTVREIFVTDGGILTDLDTSEDYQKASNKTF